MCGIAGIIDKETLDTSDLLKKILSKISYRGPDETGLIKFKNFSFGMNRLSIIDYKKHEPPYYNKNKQIWAVFNGEIYNFDNLVKEYDLKHKLRTNSDIEIIIFLYEKYGKKFVEKLNGMFSIAIFDKKLNKLLLYRDRSGEKPLYYFKKKKRFIFSSEIKSILDLVDSEVNNNYFQYKTLEICFGKETLFKDIYSLEPGDYLEIDLDTVEIKLNSYWKAWDNLYTHKSSNDEVLADELSNLLIDAISLRSANNKNKTGCFVSGGIDSSIVASILKPDYLYTIFFDIGPDFDELDYAKLIAKHIDRDLNIVTAKPSDFERTKKDITYHLDTPCTWTSFSIWRLMEESSKDIKVILSGDGADEIFAGYHRYLLLFHDQQIFELPSLKKYDYLVNNYYGHPQERYCRLINRNSDKFDIINNQKLFDYVENIFEKTNNVVNAMTITDFYSTMQVLLQMNDRLSMAFSVENRCPFLDHRIIEFGFSLNENFKIRNGKTKWLLKKVAERFVPKEIYSRIDKRGFSAPLNRWFGWDKIGKGGYQRETYKKLVYNDWKNTFLKV